MKEGYIMMDEKRKQELLALAKNRKGRTNKENAKLTSQIRSLIEKWKD